MRRSLAVIAFVAVAAVTIAATHDVPTRVTAADTAAANALLGDEIAAPAAPESFAEEIALIGAVQDRVLAAAPENEGIPEGQPRELADLMRFGKGLCFDRSRAIETILRSLGFETRHAAIYSTAATGSALKSIATPRTPSHAVTEVKTRGGWLLVDSNQRWIGLTADGRAIDLGELRRQADRRWHPLVRTPLPPIYADGRFTFVYGLYSRHGRFYPPYNIVPDVNWAELAQNI